MKIVNILARTGPFAEDKDVAADIRKSLILPALKTHQPITLDFSGVDGATQSFIHALISDAIRQVGANALDFLIFKNCNKSLQTVVGIVTDYTQDSLE